MQWKIMHGVGQSRTHQEGQSGEFEGRDCWGANQALKRRTHQSDEAAQDLCGRVGVRPAGSSPRARRWPEAETPSSVRGSERSQSTAERSIGRFEIGPLYLAGDSTGIMQILVSCISYHAYLVSRISYLVSMVSHFASCASLRLASLALEHLTN